MTVRVALIGLGYWGPILLRNFAAEPGFQVTVVCGRDETRFRSLTKAAAGIRFTRDVAAVLLDPAVDLVAIATPASTHEDLVREALAHGKHVFVEKPFVLSSEAAWSLYSLAERVGRTVWVDHTFYYTPEFQGFLEEARAERLGKPVHYRSVRADFGLFPSDTDAFWHLLYHDAYLMLALFGDRELRSVDVGVASALSRERPDIIHLMLHFDEDFTASVDVSMWSWRKERFLQLAFSRGMLIWDETGRGAVGTLHKSAEIQPDGRISHVRSDQWTALRCNGPGAIALQLRMLAKSLDGTTAPDGNISDAVAATHLTEQLASRPPGFCPWSGTLRDGSPVHPQ